MLEKRGSGILLHISSLPSPFGIGDMGEGAYRFADFLAAARQSFWQILPVHPTVSYCDNSPYMNLSAFAGNPLFISPVPLVEDGLLKKREIENPPPFPTGHVDYVRSAAFKEKLLSIAWRRFKEHAGNDIRRRLHEFSEDNADWLDDYVLFSVLRSRYPDGSWGGWPRDIRDKRSDAMQTLRSALFNETEEERFRQFLFFEQWSSLRRYCNDRRIFIIGDMPIYIGYDSADLWSHPELFQLDPEKKPIAVSGVPPDGFSKTGQLWGHPLYRWDELGKSGYAWMIRRMRHQLKLFDQVRLDHFRGFVNYWAVPATEKSAVKGRWVAAPAYHFFERLAEIIPSLPFICEDLGSSPPDFREVMDRFGLPGIKVLRYAFGSDLPRSSHAPHRYPANCVVYTTTHDDNTVKGWYAKEATSKDKTRLARYLGKTISFGELHWDFIRLAMMSVAAAVIVPMQDILGDGEEARMNRPGSAQGNWAWRLAEGRLTSALERRLLKMTMLYGREEYRKGENSAARMLNNS